MLYFIQAVQNIFREPVEDECPGKNAVASTKKITSDRLNKDVLLLQKCCQIREGSDNYKKNWEVDH